MLSWSGCETTGRTRIGPGRTGSAIIPRYYIFQTRDWDGDSYDVAMYFVRENSDGSPAKVVAGRSRYYALPIHELSTILAEAGFEWIDRVDGALHQPVVVASRPSI